MKETSDRSGVRGRCPGSDLALGARPGWTHSNLVKISVGRVVWIYAIAAPWKGVLVRHKACRMSAAIPS